MKKTIRTHQQKGVILVIALVLMVVMAVTAVAAIRLSGVDELVNNNTRARAMATQAAESAMNFCKAGVFAGTLSAASAPAGVTNLNTYTGTRWQTMSYWGGGNSGYHQLDLADLGGSMTGYTNADTRPDCLIEDITAYVEFNSTSEVSGRRSVAYRITTRGYSPNFTQDNNGLSKTGAQVWMQIVVGRVVS
ncbi:hypothetical protein CUZ56_02531 [Saezia sanguinis]|uniref:Type 4 fimbrial biogenesis protein PilX N-terminal domain-containing protein n=1 Tax=Saezia sanguinis TaxID=1965230 RepID=A0A433SB16_9BURK|nr:PilX N-terminal domain-containing pilus assembly protein [Saezia sanguinis]RUS65931.1 hypothetical protein CUZ56_02531 [Saezia sanguinis]